MTERKAPVSWRLAPRTAIAGTALAGAAFGGLLSVQVATGRDPALAAIALREARSVPRVNTTPARRIVVRRVIVTRVVTTAAGRTAATPTAPSAPVASAPPRPAAPATPAVAPPVAAPPPVVSRAS